MLKWNYVNINIINVHTLKQDRVHVRSSDRVALDLFLFFYFYFYFLSQLVFLILLYLSYLLTYLLIHIHTCAYIHHTHILIYIIYYIYLFILLYILLFPIFYFFFYFSEYNFHRTISFLFNFNFLIFTLPLYPMYCKKKLLKPVHGH